MRQTLFRIWLERPWAGWTEFSNEPPRLGACWVLLIASGLYFFWHFVQRRRDIYADPVNWIMTGVGVLALSVAPQLMRLPAWVPIYGYGMMVLLGFLAGLEFCRRRAPAVGFDPELVVDLSFWLLIGGVVGGRLAFLVQYRDLAFAEVRTFPQALFAIINLTEGGLVLIGALVGGTIAMMAFGKKRGVRVLDLGDLIIPAVFIGIGFGRIGCLLNGCCFGDRCDLPWAITFPHDSPTFQMLLERGFQAPTDLRTMPLHPTQIYSALDGFILALVTAVYFWRRRYSGDVFALGCILYSLTRIMIEFLRADEMGQLGTGLTISQIYSLLILAGGIAIMVSGPYRERRFRSRQLPASA